MAADVVDIRGLEGVLDMLKKLPPELVSKNGGVVLYGLRKGGTVIRKGWQEEVQRIIDEPNIGSQYESTGTYKKSIAATRVRNPKSVGADEAVRVRVRPNRYPDGDSAAMIAGILEHGTEAMQAKAPMRKAFESKKGQALDAIVKGINDGLAKAIKKLDKTA